MKKLLVLVLVLGMASMASAALQISVNGNPEPIDSEIILEPSDTVMLDVWTDSMIYAGAQGEGDWFLMCDNNLGTISGGAANAAIQATGNVLAIYDGKEAGAWVIESPFDGVGGGVVALGAPMMAGDVLYDQILFHCEKLGDTVISLVSGVAIVPDVGDPYVEVTGVWDEVVIHQIPEPMTMSLLGLGGLALLRRRRA